jgi:hypothetical protein
MPTEELHTMRLQPRTALTALTLTAAIAATAAGTADVAAAAPTAPPGYTRVFAPPIPIPPSPLDFGGQVTCPSGTVPWGGGAGFSGGFASQGENINTSAPNGDGWRARYNNSGTRPDDHFTVEAICAQQPAGYTTAFATADNPAGSQNGVTATCPSGTVVLSGGTLSTGDTADVELLSAWPLGPHRFRSVMWNGSDTFQRVTTFAICAQRPPHYDITHASGTDTGGPDTEVGGQLCAPGSKIIGGGVQITTPRPLVTIGASFSDSGDQWVAEVVNLDPAPATMTISAICAA